MSNLTHEPYAYIHGLGYYLSVQIGPVMWQYGMSLEQFLKEKADPSFDKTHPYFWLNPKTQKYESFPDKQSLREALTPSRKYPLLKQTRIVKI